MLELAEKQMLIQALGQVIYDEVQAAVKPLQDRIVKLETELAEKTDVAFLREYVTGAIAAKEDSHADRPDGKSLCLDDLRPGLADLVAEVVRSLPVQPHCTGGIIDRDGALSLTFSDGGIKNMGKIVGADGKDCDMELVRRQVAEFLATVEKPKDGVDGLGIEQIEYDGERTFRLANAKVDRSFVIPFPIYQGLWKQRNYSRGDEVTSDGSQFIAMRDTDKEPGTVDSGWRLACKRGGVGSRGPPGKDATVPPNDHSRPGQAVIRSKDDGKL
jgi:hypothetical protein